MRPSLAVPWCSRGASCSSGYSTWWEKKLALYSVDAEDLSAEDRLEVYRRVEELSASMCIFGGERGLPAVLSSTHPPVEKRIHRLREMPA